MSWTRVFPVLGEELVENYQHAVAADGQEDVDFLLPAKVINPRKVRHIASTSLFRHPPGPEKPPAMDHALPSATETVTDGNSEIHENNAKTYLGVFLESARGLHNRHPDLAVRVYLGADLECLIPCLKNADCEVVLMRKSSPGVQPGTLWRYLALEERSKLITIFDISRVASLEFDVRRTEEVSKIGLKFWRIPAWDENPSPGVMSYRPILGSSLGSCKRMPVRTLMQALIWHTRQGGISRLAQSPDCGPQEIQGTSWEDSRFDEWFLMTCIYPRVAPYGILTFVPTVGSSGLLPLDIEYVMWACRKSELIYFRPNGRNCC